MAYVEQHPAYPLFRRKTGNLLITGGSSSGLAGNVMREVLTPAPDGKTRVFNLTYVPIQDSEMVFRDGLFMNKGDANDYTISGSQITFAEPPPAGSVIVVYYRY